MTFFYIQTTLLSYVYFVNIFKQQICTHSQLRRQSPLYFLCLTTKLLHSAHYFHIVQSVEVINKVHLPTHDKDDPVMFLYRCWIWTQFVHFRSHKNVFFFYSKYCHLYIFTNWLGNFNLCWSNLRLDVCNFSNEMKNFDHHCVTQGELILLYNVLCVGGITVLLVWIALEKKRQSLLRVCCEHPHAHTHERLRSTFTSIWSTGGAHKNKHWLSAHKLMHTFGEIIPKSWYV